MTTRHQKQKFLVVSYDEDQQQWFYDHVQATSEQEAAALICRIRPYVIAAEASTLPEVLRMARRIARKSAKDIRTDLLPIAKESGVRL
jgi:hypothetical protein